MAIQKELIDELIASSEGSLIAVRASHQIAEWAKEEDLGSSLLPESTNRVNIGSSLRRNKTGYHGQTGDQ